MHRWLMVFLIVSLVASRSASAQTLTYHVVKGGKTIGNMICKKYYAGDTLVYAITSETTFKLLVVSFHLKYDLVEKFVNGVLVSGHAENYLNGKPQKVSRVSRVRSDYDVMLNNKLTKFVGASFGYTIPELYYSEPGTRTKIFSQQFADFLTIVKEGPGEYGLINSDGKNMYLYENGICKQVNINRVYASFSFDLVGSAPIKKPVAKDHNRP